MPTDFQHDATPVRVPVRTGSYQYVLVRPDGSSTTVHVDREALDAGSVEVAVSQGDRVIEVALSSTSDPDLDPPRGELARLVDPMSGGPDLTSMLFVPAGRPRMIEKARTLDAPAVIVDLEDGVGAGEKEAARASLAEALAGWPERPLLFVRVNGPETDLFVDDLRAVAPLAPYGVCVPKCETEDDVLRAETNLHLGGAPDDVRLLPFVESPLGVVNAFEIARATERVVAVALGSEDLAARMGLRRTKEGAELAYFRGAVATAAHAAHAIPIDGVFIDFHDPEGLARDAAAGRALGFGGKQIVHPSQVEPVARAYSPTRDELEQARRIVEAFEAAEREGAAVVVVDGRMIDRPIVLQARRLLAADRRG